MVSAARASASISGALGGTGVLQLVDDQMREASRDGLGQSGPLAEESGQLKHCVGVVHRAGGAQHLVVQLVDLGELALPGGRVALRLALARLLLRPASEPLRRHPCGLERVDPVDDPGQQPSRVPADLMPAQGQLVDPLQQHREPLGGAERLEERVELRLGRRAPAGAAPRRRGACGRRAPRRQSRSSPRRGPGSGSPRRSSGSGQAVGPPSPTSRASLRARASVRPLPAAPSTSSGPRSWATTAACCSLSPGSPWSCRSAIEFQASAPFSRPETNR